MKPLQPLTDAMAEKVGVYGVDFADVELSADETRGLGTSRGVKRKNIVDHLSEKKQHHNEQLGQGHSERAFGSGPMVGFGLPNETMHLCNRTLSDIAEGPPYFYFENVACTPKGVWDKMSRFLYVIEPEFVDSKYFCAATRKRLHSQPSYTWQISFPSNATKNNTGCLSLDEDVVSAMGSKDAAELCTDRDGRCNINHEGEIRAYYLGWHTD